MVVDSPYAFTQPVGSPAQGAVLGAGAALCMLLPLRLLGHASYLVDLSALMTRPCPSGCGIGGIGVGVLIHLATGALLGALYAVSQQRAPLRAVVAVGIFYGFFIWLASRFVISALMPVPLALLLRSWHWLATTVSYGLVLAWVAWRIDVSRPASADEVVQLD